MLISRMRGVSGRRLTWHVVADTLTTCQNCQYIAHYTQLLNSWTERSDNTHSALYMLRRFNDRLIGSELNRKSKRTIKCKNLKHLIRLVLWANSLISGKKPRETSPKRRPHDRAMLSVKGEVHLAGGEEEQGTGGRQYEMNGDDRKSARNPEGEDIKEKCPNPSTRPLREDGCGRFLECDRL